MKFYQRKGLASAVKLLDLQSYIDRSLQYNFEEIKITYIMFSFFETFPNRFWIVLGTNELDMFDQLCRLRFSGIGHYCTSAC